MDNFAKIKFDADYMKAIDACITRSIIIFNKILPKYKAGRYADLNRLQSVLIDIKQYAYHNIGIIPASDKLTTIKHHEKSVRRVRNAKQSLKVLHGSLNGPKQREQDRGRAAILDILNQFETYLTKTV